MEHNVEKFKFLIKSIIVTACVAIILYNFCPRYTKYKDGNYTKTLNIITGERSHY